MVIIKKMIINKGDEAKRGHDSIRAVVLNVLIFI